MTPEMVAAQKEGTRAMWALGDYHRFATSTVWQLGPRLVQACGISAGQRVLDVAAGTGNVAIRAASAGAIVTASDLTPENFAAGRRAAQEAGVALEWAEADAEALPFDADKFDVVTSCLGAIFASDQHAVAREMVRVCRPGGTIGLITFTPEGAGGDFFRVLAPYAPPPPPGVLSPVLWGDEEHVRHLFAGGVASLTMSKHEYTEEADSAQQYADLFNQTFGPMIAIRGGLADADRLALDRDFSQFIDRWNRAAPGGRVEVPYEYLLIIARKA